MVSPWSWDIGAPSMARCVRPGVVVVAERSAAHILAVRGPAYNRYADKNPAAADRRRRAVDALR